MVNDINKFVFVHIPKTGGSSISRALNLGLNEKFYVKHIIDKINSNNYKSFQGYFKFAFHRNPWDRLVSLWKYWTVQRNSKAIISLRILERYPEAKDFDGFCYNLNGIFSDFLQKEFYLLNQVDLNGQSEYININYWGRFKYLDQDFEKICEMIGIPYSKLPKLNSTVHDNYQNYYNNELKKYVGKLYEKDIDTFKYTFKD